MRSIAPLLLLAVIAAGCGSGGSSGGDNNLAEDDPTAQPEPVALTPEPEPVTPTPEPEPVTPTPEPEPVAPTPEPVTGSPIDALYGNIRMDYWFSIDPSVVFTKTFGFDQQNLTDEGQLIQFNLQGESIGCYHLQGTNYGCLGLYPNGDYEMFDFDLDFGVGLGNFEFCFSNVTVEDCTVDLFLTPDGPLRVTIDSTGRTSEENELVTSPAGSHGIAISYEQATD